MKINFNPFKKSNQTNQFDNDNTKNNPNYQVFAHVNQDIQQIINQRSVIANAAKNINQKYSIPTWDTYFSGDLLAMPLATSKMERIQQYRRIASYDITDWCFDEIADDFIHEDDDGNVITLKLPDRLVERQQEILQNEFEKYMSFFNLKNDGYNLVKRFLTEGELAWENVISKEHPSMGIKGIKFLPAEYYETLVDVQTSRPVGLVFDVETFSDNVRQAYRTSFMNGASIFNALTPQVYSFKFSKDTCVPLLFNQVTYINSGEYSPDFLMSYPLIEKAKMAYQALSLMEEAAVILRVTHAPERLLFNVSTSGMPNKLAEEYVRRFANELKSKKVATPDGSDINGVYSPITMLKSFVFGKSSTSDGTSVESVGSSATYSEMEDIEYFLRKFLKKFKIPFSRYKTPENTLEKNDSITQEEYAFSRMIIRYQRRFCDGFKKGFITHLRLNGLWDKDSYMLKESDIDIQMTKPVLYDLYQTQKLVETKMNIYNAMTSSNDEMSKSLFMKKLLGWTDDQVKENYMSLIKDKQMTAVGEMMGELVSAENPPVDIQSPLRLKNDVSSEEKDYSAKSGNTTTSSNSGDDAGDESDEYTGDEDSESEDEEDTKDAEEPSFGLG